MKKLTLLSGGQSSEHDVSLRSADYITKLLESQNYQLQQIRIEKNGSVDSGDLLSAIKKIHAFNPDKIIPILHGTNGEDGRIQGLFELLDYKIAGSDSLGSSICFSKSTTNRILDAVGIPQAKYLVVSDNSLSWSHVMSQLGETVFVKPDAQGSSVGVSRCTTESEYKEAIVSALEYSNCVLIEEAIQGIELECVVLKNNYKTWATSVGSVEVTKGFYDYNQKYNSSEHVKINLPAQIPEPVSKKVQELAIKAFKACKCSDYARVDFFMNNNGQVFLNEINTIPGFTPTSMAPKLIEHDCFLDEFISILIG